MIPAALRLIELGLVLFLITVVINMLGKRVIKGLQIKIP